MTPKDTPFVGNEYLEADQRFAQVYARDRNELLQYIKGKLSRAHRDGKEVAEDVLSAASEKVLNRNRISPVEELRAFLRVVAVNELRNFFRHGKVVHRTEDAVAYHYPNIVVSPEYALLDEEFNEVMRELVSQLPPRCRFAIHCSFQGQLSAREILVLFEDQGIYVGERQVQRYINQGLEACKTILERYLECEKTGRHR